jgi:exodeoxyribonuclease VII small subunit
MKQAKQSFEQALARLEDIVETIENSETALDDAIKLYKEGLTLSKTCGSMLNRYETEITRLQQEADGTFTEQPFPVPGNNGTDA